MKLKSFAEILEKYASLEKEAVSEAIEHIGG